MAAAAPPAANGAAAILPANPAANPPPPAILPAIGNDEALAQLDHAALAALLAAHGVIPRPRRRDERIARLRAIKQQQVQQGGAGGGGGGGGGANAQLHQYDPASALANCIARFYGLTDLARLPAPRWSEPMLLSPATWLLVVQLQKYTKGCFPDGAERLAPALQPFRIGLQVAYVAINDPTQRRLEKLYRSMATEYSALTLSISAADIERLIFVDIAEAVAAATAEVYDLYARQHGVPAAARAILDASRALALTSLPSHMAGTGQAMMRVMEKTAFAAVTGAKRSKSVDVDNDTFYCKRCDAFFSDPNHKLSPGHKAKGR